MDSCRTFPIVNVDEHEEFNDELTVETNDFPGSGSSNTNNHATGSDLRSSLRSRDNAPTRPNRRSTMQLVPFHFRPTIMLFGDSLTQYGFGMNGEAGWAALLSSAYQRRADVLNRGFSGYNTFHAQGVLNRTMGKLETNVLFLTVWFGANDAATPDSCQHVPIEEYRDNLETIVNRLRVQLNRHRTFPILLLTPPPVDEVALCKAFERDVPDRKNELARAYGDVVKEIAALDVNCAVVDTWDVLDGETEERGKYLWDGLHLNGEGNRKVFHAIMDTIKTHFPKLAPMEDGDGKNGSIGIPMEEKLWTELCSNAASK